ncbi:CYTB protein, partial [Formicarius rufipectus]|nr:CYTB protein [Formicarius rufipectus]
KVKSQLEEKEGKTFDVFTAVEFKTQLVAGINYFIKVHIGNDKFMHLRVFESLPQENKPLSLHSYQGSKTKHDELAYF